MCLQYFSMDQVFHLPALKTHSPETLQTQKKNPCNRCRAGLYLGGFCSEKPQLIRRISQLEAQEFTFKENQTKPNQNETPFGLWVVFAGWQKVPQRCAALGWHWGGFVTYYGIGGSSDRIKAEMVASMETPFSKCFMTFS